MKKNSIVVPSAGVLTSADLLVVDGGTPPSTTTNAGGRSQSAPGRIESAPFNNSPPAYQSQTPSSVGSYTSRASNDPSSSQFTGQTREQGEAMFPGFAWSGH